jgi:hypothetical protein
MNKDDLTEKLRGYGEGKITWVDLAYALNMAVEQGIPIDGNYISQKKVKDIRRALRAAQEFGILGDDRILKIQPQIIGYLGFLKKSVKNDFDKIIEDVLAGKRGRLDLSKLARKGRGLDLSNYQKFDNLRRRMVLLTRELKGLIEEGTAKEYLAKESNELEHVLRCIFDEDFKKAYAVKEEIKV